MATPLPPWLQISPDQFTQAAIAGGQQGYQAAAQAGELAQRGLLQAAELASQAANRAAEIAVRREAINASLAENAARVSAAQSEAAAQNAIRQQQIELARAAEQNNIAQEQARLAAAQELKAMDIQGEKDVAGIRANAPQTFAPSEDVRTLDAIKRFRESGDNASADILENIMVKRGATTEKLPVADQKELEAIAKRQAELSLLQRQGTGLTEEQVVEREKLAKRLRQLETRPIAPVAAPLTPVGGPRRYELINGQLQLAR